MSCDWSIYDAKRWIGRERIITAYRTHEFREELDTYAGYGGILERLRQKQLLRDSEVAVAQETYPGGCYELEDLEDVEGYTQTCKLTGMRAIAESQRRAASYAREPDIDFARIKRIAEAVTAEMITLPNGELGYIPVKIGIR